MLLVYLPVDILYFHGAQRVIGAPAGGLAWAIWAGVFPVILLASAVAHHLIAQPAAAWLNAHSPFADQRDGAQPQPGNWPLTRARP